MKALTIWEPVLGKILGRATLAVVIPVHALTGLTKTEALLGDYSIGRYAWKMENPIRLPEPIPYKGQQGLWTWMQ